MPFEFNKGSVYCLSTKSLQLFIKIFSILNIFKLMSTIYTTN